MRISDWSSDVCSSNLEWGYMQWIWKATHNEDFFGIPAAGKTTYTRGTTTQFYRDGKIVRCRTHWNFREFAMQLGVIPFRSEEHTSELQSLMRISYAVFCLKKTIIL